MKKYRRPQIKVKEILMDNSLLAASPGINNEKSESEQLAKPSMGFDDDSWEEDNAKSSTKDVW